MIAFVLFAGVLCILTAGFIFESMKRSPMVLVLGTLVALTGTFLMFREVRGFFWPATSAAGTSETRIAPAPSPGASVKPPPITSTPPELATP